MTSVIKPTDIPLLLEVFREGLRHGIVSKDEIVSRADQVISENDESDYFFIEISLSHNVNELAEILDVYVVKSESPIPFRVLLGVIYKNLVVKENITIAEAIAFIGRCRDLKISTKFEYNRTWEFDDYDFSYSSISDELSTDIKEFLSTYEDFSLYNYTQWHEINDNVNDVLKDKESAINALYKEYDKNRKKYQLKRKLNRYVFFGLFALLLVGIIATNLIMMKDSPTFSMLLRDHENLFLMDVFGSYFLLRVAYKIWKIKRRQH